MTLSSSFTLSGPLFAKDVSKTMLQNIEDFMADLAQKGAADAERGLREGAGGRAAISRLGDRVADHVVGRTMARPSRGGRRWHVFGVVQVSNEGLSKQQGISLMAAASEVEGRTGVIRGVARRIGQNIRKVDLTKGLE